MHEFRDLRAREKRIGIRARVIGRAGKSQVGNRRQHGNSDKSRVGGDGFAGEARREYQCEITSGGISRKGNPANSAHGKPLITCQYIVRGGRKGMFGGKPIVRDKSPRSRSRGNVPNKMAVGLGRSKVEPTTMQMDDRLFRPPIHRLYPNSRYPAEGAYFECHVVARRNALHKCIEWSACFDSAWHALGGTSHCSYRGSDRRVLRIERMDYDKVRRCAVCGRSLHSQFLIELEWEKRPEPRLVKPKREQQHSGTVLSFPRLRMFLPPLLGGAVGVRPSTGSARPGLR